MFNAWIWGWNLSSEILISTHRLITVILNIPLSWKPFADSKQRNKGLNMFWMLKIVAVIIYELHFFKKSVSDYLPLN